MVSILFSVVHFFFDKVTTILCPFFHHRCWQSFFKKPLSFFTLKDIWICSHVQISTGYSRLQCYKKVDLFGIFFASVQKRENKGDESAPILFWCSNGSLSFLTLVFLSLSLISVWLAFFGYNYFCFASFNSIIINFFLLIKVLFYFFSIANYRNEKVKHCHSAIPLRIQEKRRSYQKAI